MLARLRAVYWWVVFLVWTIFWLVIVTPFAMLPAFCMRLKGFALKAIVSFWARGAVFLSGSKIVMKGREKLPDGPLIIAANHSSWMDVFSLFGEIRRPGAFVAKKSLFWIPWFGWAMWRLWQVPLTRGNSEKDKRSLAKLLEKIRWGNVSVFWFPEGTRSMDGKLAQLKKGLYYFATETMLPVVPVAVEGAHKIQPKGSFKMFPGQVTLNILDPINITDYAVPGDATEQQADEKRDSFIKDLRGRLAKALGQE
ncbi:MAG: 1-acyl-sn-glycerol-3-phosphate acyltransferase [Planctomycetes bacterium]|nr:1-acyl-sn-glycerol-3-phosphate acyltransferase [Planctomycetota bacterium]